MSGGSATHVLYRLFSNNGELLYVGVTKDLNARLRAHANTQKWWGLVHHSATGIEWFATPESASRAEQAAIRDEEPVFNVDGRGLARPAEYAGKGGRPRSEDPRNQRMPLNLTAAEKALVERAAALDGMKPMEWAREKTLAAAKRQA